MNRITRYSLLSLTVVLAGCGTLEEFTHVAADLGASTGLIDSQHASSIKKGSSAVIKAAEDLTPEQEYYIGRTVAATILSDYQTLDNRSANAYVSTLGQALVLASDMPDTFAGYHFQILDSDEINGFAAPGGFVFITTGLIECCESESALAAVLAHEIAHVTGKHGLAAIKKNRWTEVGTTLAAEGVKNTAGAEAAALTGAFEGVVDDIVKQLVYEGYSRSSEKEADATAVKILQRIGYNPSALVTMLEVLEENTHSHDGGFGKTHPPAQVRIKGAKKSVATSAGVEENAAMRARFQRFQNSL